VALGFSIVARLSFSLGLMPFLLEALNDQGFLFFIVCVRSALINIVVLKGYNKVNDQIPSNICFQPNFLVTIPRPRCKSVVIAAAVVNSVQIMGHFKL
jgi:hypothetical protein